MFNKKNETRPRQNKLVGLANGIAGRARPYRNGRATASTESGQMPYCDQIIIAMLLVIIIAVPLYFDIHLHSVFDLSKITILYVLTFAMLAIWSIKTMITCRTGDERYPRTKGRRGRTVSSSRPSSLISHPTGLLSSLEPTINSTNFSFPVCQWICHGLFHKSLFKFSRHLQTIRRFYINYCIHLTFFRNYTFHR